MTLSRHCDFLVIGAGPAGLAAATEAAAAGADTIVLDEQVSPGGQIYRAITTTPLTDRGILGADYWHGAELLEPFRRSGAAYIPGASVWSITPAQAAEGRANAEIGYSIGGQAHSLHARHILLATGAIERPVPIPGWTLPGVITAGAAQILLKQGGIAPTGRTVMAGCGPLLYLIAWQYLNAGIKIDAILETTSPGNLRRALPHAGGFLRSAYRAKGMRLLRAVRAAVPIIKHVQGIEAIGSETVGSEAVERVRFQAGGVTQTLDVDQLLLHMGVVPNVNLSRALGLDHCWNEAMACWEPEVDQWGVSSLEYVSVAGDGAGIAGALAAEQRGRIAGLHAAHRLGLVDGDARGQRASPMRAALARAVRGRRFFDTLYKPPHAMRCPTGKTVVCRCEEVTAEEICQAARLGAQGPNQMKSFLRCGMGPCQGRFCGLTVSEIIARERGVRPQDVGYYRLRFPTKPLTLGELASLPQTDASRGAVVRFKK